MRARIRTPATGIGAKAGDPFGGKIGKKTATALGTITGAAFCFDAPVGLAKALHLVVVGERGGTVRADFQGQAAHGSGKELLGALGDSIVHCARIGTPRSRTRGWNRAGWGDRIGGTGGTRALPHRCSTSRGSACATCPPGRSARSSARCASTRGRPGGWPGRGGAVVVAAAVSLAATRAAIFARPATRLDDQEHVADSAGGGAERESH